MPEIVITQSKKQLLKRIEELENENKSLTELVQEFRFVISEQKIKIEKLRKYFVLEDPYRYGYINYFIPYTLQQ